MKKHNATIYEKYIKRFLDIFISCTVLLVFGWLYIIIAILVRCKLGSPVLFKQARPGKGEVVFNMYKFRTMNENKDENGNLLPDMQRLTKFGRFLRNSSLDELPELFNILKGEMSLIGPRPLLVKYLPLYNEFQHRRHEVLPGLTGYSQAHGRNSTSWEKRFEMDVYYVDHISFFTDVKIIFATIKSVLKKEGIDSSETKTVTMEEFKGSKED